MPVISTPRLTLEPVSGRDLQSLIVLKANPLVYGQMLGGVRSSWQTIDELAQDRMFWGERGIGMFAIREGTVFQGMTGIHDRPDGLGLALRFAVWPDARGRGLAREAASAALRYAMNYRRISRVIAVAREDNFSSRMVLGSIGMVCRELFHRDGHAMLVYESTL